MLSHRSITRLAILALAAAAISGCERSGVAPEASRSVSRSASPFPDVPVTLEWQEQARMLVAAGRLNALAAGRVYAALSVAQHRAVREVDAGAPVAPENQDNGFGPGGRSGTEARRGAVAGASARVLGFIFPASAALLEDKLAAQAKAGPGGVHPHFERGAAAGRAAGDAMVVHLQNDGFTAPWTGTVPTGPDKFVPLALPPGGAMLGQVTPYYLSSGSQLRSAPPPAFGSAEFDADLSEVLVRTQGRTPEELAFAKYWDFPLGTPTPIGFWNGAAAQYVADRNLDERGATEVFALMHAAMFDALIGCWEAKYHYWTIRPSQAEPDITLAFGLPNFPSYPSGHSCASASAGSVLAHFFPDRAAELDGWVEDAGLSRILAGIHYRFDVTAGQQLGRSVAELAISRGAP